MNELGGAGVGGRLHSHRRALACKSRAGQVEQCVGGVRPRRIFGTDLGPSAVVVGSLLHDCYMVGTLLITSRVQPSVRILHRVVFAVMAEGIVSPTRSAGMVEAIVTLPFSFLVDATCLGTTTSELIGSTSADIVLPGLTAGENNHLSAPHIYSIKSEVNWSERLYDHAPWGTIRSYNKDNTGRLNVTAWIKHILLRLYVAGEGKDAFVEANNIGSYLNDRIEDWSENIGTWFEIVSESYLPRSGEKGSAPLVFGDSRMWFFDGIKATLLPHVVKVRFPITDPPVADLKCWRQILAVIAKGSTPPVEHVLLRDARQGIFEEQTRRAVLDAASAAEISLAALLDKQIKSVPLPVQQVVRGATNSLGSLITTLRKNFKISLRPDVDNVLAHLRNRSIHGGFKPSLDEAKCALEIATEIVEMVNPRGALLQNVS